MVFWGFPLLCHGLWPETTSSPGFGRRRWKRKSFVIAGKSSLFFSEDVTCDYKPSFLSLAPSKDHFSPKGRREMVFGRGQRQETGFVIAGYVLAKEQRGLTSDYKRFPLPSSPAKGRRRCCLGPKPETRKRKSPENHLWPRPAGRHERRTAISFKSLVFRGPEVVFWDPKRTRAPARGRRKPLCRAFTRARFLLLLFGWFGHTLALESQSMLGSSDQTPGPR